MTMRCGRMVILVPRTMMTCCLVSLSGILAPWFEALIRRFELSDERDLFALYADTWQGQVMQTASSAGDRTHNDQQLPHTWQHGHHGPQHNMSLPSDAGSSFYSDDEYDAIFTNLADEIEHSQDMDMAL